jgi:copper(I)-binding protein
MRTSRALARRRATSLYSSTGGRVDYSAAGRRLQNISTPNALRWRYDFDIMVCVHRAGRRIAVACGFGLALAAPQASALFIVNQPWVRPAHVARSTEAYMNLTSTDGATLIGVTSDAAASVAIMRPGAPAKRVDRLPLPARTVVALAPGGDRIALSRLARTLRLGDRVQLTLMIEAADGSRQHIGVDAEVRLRSPIDDEMRAHKHAH